jgi:hypothetical protein
MVRTDIERLRIGIQLDGGHGNAEDAVGAEAGDRAAHFVGDRIGGAAADLVPKRADDLEQAKLIFANTARQPAGVVPDGQLNRPSETGTCGPENVHRASDDPCVLGKVGGSRTGHLDVSRDGTGRKHQADIPTSERQRATIGTHVRGYINDVRDSTTVAAAARGEEEETQGDRDEIAALAAPAGPAHGSVPPSDEVTHALAVHRPAASNRSTSKQANAQEQHGVPSATHVTAS